MAAVFTAESVEQVLHNFYCNVDSEMNQYLMQAQLSPSAWIFSWQLLQPEKPAEVQFFGACTLQQKIVRHWHELPADQYQSLRERLLAALVAYAGGPKFVMTRLCTAVAGVIIRTISDSWTTAIVDVIATLQPANLPSVQPDIALSALLELLTVLPEELDTSHLSPDKRPVVRGAFQETSGVVLGLVQGVMEGLARSESRQVALKCFSGWAQLQPSVLEDEALLDQVILAAREEDLAQTALEALANVATQPNSHKYPVHVLRLLEKMLTLQDLAKKFTEEHNMELLCSLYGALISIGETHCRMLLDSLDQKESVLARFVGLVLECSGTPGRYPIDEICSELAFGFWYSLQDEIVASQPGKCKVRMQLFRPVFQSLVDTYLLKVQYPPDDQFQSWHEDEKESFRCYRQDIGDSFMYCYGILREDLLASLASHISNAADVARNDPTQWQYLESCLYGFQSVAESVDADKSSLVSSLFANLQSLPMTNSRLLSTCMDAIGAYADWMNAHPRVLDQLVPLLLQGLRGAAPSATMALKDISRACHDIMQPHAQQILQVAKEAILSQFLRPRERVRLMHTVGQLLGVVEPSNAVPAYLDSLLVPLMHELAAPAGKAVVVLHLNMMSALLCSLEARQPLLLVFQQFLPLLSSVGESWATDEQVTEALCELLKRGIGSLLDECRPFLPDLLQLLLALHLSRPNAGVLDVSKQVLLLFRQDQDLESHLGSYFSRICQHTVQICQSSLHEQTALVEVFFQTLGQVTKKTPKFLLPSSPEVIFQLGVMALALPEKATVKSSAHFLVEFITCCRDSAPLLDVVNACGQELVGQILRVIGGEGPRACVESMPDLLMALNKKFFDNLTRWLAFYVSVQNFPSARASREHKERFVQAVLRQRANKRKLQEIVGEFSLLCRGLIGTEYGSQTMPFF